MLWLDLSRERQLPCVRCFNGSGPTGGHGTTTRDDWVRVLDQAAAWGVRRVQCIGGEPTMHPDAADLVEHAPKIGLSVEVYTDLVHVSVRWGTLFRRPGGPASRWRRPTTPTPRPSTTPSPDGSDGRAKTAAWSSPPPA
ncbi:radical SAM protein [Spirillospora sp. CA-142024]|uniref:radical SAM protein n=1 Tax=Spirillospora sp. CA-142024 TaxID=3240036 RepID=UPI003D8FA3E0